MESPSTKRTYGWFDHLINLLAIVAGFLICAVVVLICVDVLSRNTGALNMPWSLEVAQYAMLLITFLGAPWVLREQGHIVVDLLLQNLSPEKRMKVDRVGHVVCAIVCAALTYVAFRVLLRSYQSGVTKQESFVFPEWWLMSVAPPVFLMLMVIFIRWIFNPPARPADETDDGL